MVELVGWQVVLVAVQIVAWCVVIVDKMPAAGVSVQVPETVEVPMAVPRVMVIVHGAEAESVKAELVYATLLPSVPPVSLPTE